jgi:formate hydrogenlyase subunit 3/multisubunit Na+/H+ antiporter MnhD subunit
MSERKAGFRLSIVDVLFIAAAAVAVVLLRERLGTWVWSIPVAVGHFFLFCNVFRVRRSYELIWVGIFFANAAAWVALDRFSWLNLLAVQTPFTLAAFVLEMRSRRYHGIFASRLNPHLEDWTREGSTPR